MADEAVRGVLGIPVDDELLVHWRSWWAPPRQPFPLDDLPEDQVPHLPPGSDVPGGTLPPAGRSTDEVRDTFFVYAGSWCWLTRDELAALPAEARRALLSARRRRIRPKPAIAWPGEPGLDRRLLAWVAAGVPASRHAEVPDATWETAGGVLPGARRLAGTFPGGSGPNCFGTVMAAAGVPGAEEEWMTQEPFRAWLEGHAEPVESRERDDEPGTVLVWHERDELAHAAVTLGNGWVLNKPSQAWSSPRLVWPVRRVIGAWTFAGTRLSRWRVGC